MVQEWSSAQRAHQTYNMIKCSESNILYHASTLMRHRQIRLQELAGIVFVHNDGIDDQHDTFE